jgi:hypothetical protein
MNLMEAVEHHKSWKVPHMNWKEPWVYHRSWKALRMNLMEPLEHHKSWKVQQYVKIQQELHKSLMVHCRN